MTTREDRKAPPGIDRERALAALIFCASKHPEQRLGQLVTNAYLRSPAFGTLFNVRDEDLAAAFHAYAKEQ